MTRGACAPKPATSHNPQRLQYSISNRDEGGASDSRVLLVLDVIDAKTLSWSKPPKGETLLSTEYGQGMRLNLRNVWLSFLC